MQNNNFIKKNIIAGYFCLAFMLSWGFIIVIAGINNIPIDPLKSQELMPLLYISMLIGPIVSSLIFIGIDNGKEGFHKLFSSMRKFRLNFKWYFLAMLVAPVSALLVLSILSFFSSDFHFGFLKTDNTLNLIINGLVAGIMVGIFEEIGWTGFVIQRLLKKLSIIKIGLLVGILWGAWHFILFWENNSFLGTLPFLILLSRLFSWLPPYRIFMTWLYKQTDSLFLTILTHVSLVFTVTVIVPVTLLNRNLLIWLLSWSIVQWIVVIVIMNLKKFNSPAKEEVDNI